MVATKVQRYQHAVLPGRNARAGITSPIYPPGLPLGQLNNRLRQKIRLRVSFVIYTTASGARVLFLCSKKMISYGKPGTPNARFWQHGRVPQRRPQA